jgi:poly(A)-specific ribonuclease
MDINKNDWPFALQPLLTALSNAHFVSLDFELSGIATKSMPKSTNDQANISRKQTLQERYEEVKVAAEKYQILQMGITAVKEDLTRGKSDAVTFGGPNINVARRLHSSTLQYLFEPIC